MERKEMCGIFASIGIEPDPARIDIVAHRGPDGRGWVVLATPSGPLALGHRRLAIIDTSDAGAQPMFHSNQRFALTFNGEIYNYREIRTELEARGEVFRTESDTEVLLRALVVWGVDALNRLRGMFAFVFLDQKEKRLLAVRDRFGIKPLYYVQRGSAIAFGSEIKQLLNISESGTRMNPQRVADFLIYGFSDHTDETLFNGIRQLKPGELGIYHAVGEGSAFEVQRWYERPTTGCEITFEAACDKFRELLDSSVRSHLIADVSVGSCLSGGLDSSSIVCLASRALELNSAPGRFKTVSACFSEKRVDEKPYIDCVVQHANAEPCYLYPRSDEILGVASEMTWHHDEPFGSTSAFAQWSVFSRANQEGIKVMLDGQGADEQLAGYVTAFPYLLKHQLLTGNLSNFVRTILARKKLVGEPVRQQLLGVVPVLAPDGWLPYLHRQRQKRFLSDWLGRGELAKQTYGPTAMQTASSANGLPEPRDIASLCEHMTFGSNLQRLLHWEDRNSMAHGIEARVPFLDHPLVEFNLRLGNAHKIVKGETKAVLRRGMQGILPRQIVERHDKLGFATPEAEWFRGPMRSAIAEGVENTLRRFPGLLDDAGVRMRAKRMLDGELHLNFWLWRIVNLGIWGKRFKVTA